MFDFFPQPYNSRLGGGPEWLIASHWPLYYTMKLKLCPIQKIGLKNRLEKTKTCTVYYDISLLSTGHSGLSVLIWLRNSSSKRVTLGDEQQSILRCYILCYICISFYTSLLIKCPTTYHSDFHGAFLLPQNLLILLFLSLRENVTVVASQATHTPTGCYSKEWGRVGVWAADRQEKIRAHVAQCAAEPEWYSVTLAGLIWGGKAFIWRGTTPSWSSI